ncbi:general substrate transporter [Aspergillus karnatakaensis]|uniref:sugar porter family MFS transporter n=1 Tax=Aspergillus karnatakaensis TaxID=1810916 RepID=UPI003CCDD2CC
MASNSDTGNALYKGQKYLFGVQGRALRNNVSLAGAFGFLLFGYDQGFLSGLIARESFLEQFDHPSASLLGTISAIYEIGCFCGAVTVFFVGSSLGRKKCIYIGALLQTIGAILQAASFGVPQLIVGRIVCGWGNGFNTATTPLWVSELVPANTRGRHIAIEGNLIAFGIVLAYYFNIGMSYASGQVQWRLVIAFQIVIIMFQTFWTVMLPESPRWLSQAGRHEEATHILTQITGKNLTPEHRDVVTLKREIDDAIALELEEGEWKFSECFKDGPLKIRHRFMLAIGLQAMQQLSGINLLVFYAPHTLTTDIGMDYGPSLHVGAGLGLTYWVFSFFGIFYLDKMGRRPPLVYGALGCAICFLCAGILQKDITPDRAKASLTFLFLYEAIFAIGWLPVPWMYAPEIMPLRHRTHSAAIAAASDWIFNYAVVQFAPVAIKNIRWKTYMIFFVLNVTFAAVVWLFYPETKGRSLEEIDQLYMGENDRFVVVDRRGKLLPGFRGRSRRADGDVEASTGVVGQEESSEKSSTFAVHDESGSKREV